MQSRAGPVRPSELLRGQPANSSGLVTGGNVWGARYRIPDHPDSNQQQEQDYYSQNVVAGERILPSDAFSKDGDALDKYRIKDESAENTSSGSPITWVVQLRNIPTESGSPIELKISGNTVFYGEGEENVVTTQIASTVNSSSAGTSIALTVPSVGFVFQRNLADSNGLFIRFSAESTGMKFRQQKVEFSD